MNYPVSIPTITQYFGANPQDYFQYGYPGHNGLDLWTADRPAFIYSVEEGIVEKVGYEQGGYGKYIVIRHDKFKSYYAHLSAVYVVPGAVCLPAQAGAAAQIVALMGSTGNSTGPHLHLGIRTQPHEGPYKGYIDPLPVLTFTAPPLPVGEGAGGEGVTGQATTTIAKQPKKPYTIGSVIVARHGRIMFRMKKHY